MLLRHEGHEAAVGTAVDAGVVAVTLLGVDQPVQAVLVVFQFRVAHVAVDRRTPVAAVALAAAVIHVQHDVALLHQQVVEHLLAEVGRVALVHVLQVAGAVHEHHDRVLAARLLVFRFVVLGPDHAGAMLGRHRHQLRLDPLAGLVVGGAGIGQHARLAAGTGQHRQLRRQVGELG
ncbi:hypothetical protein G6F59_015336 [Rhizopus arrhizus]|nr:hypothetical protein G6F59_015336 [Rhizopus arrhizus]